MDTERTVSEIKKEFAEKLAEEIKRAFTSECQGHWLPPIEVIPEPIDSLRIIFGFHLVIPEHRVCRVETGRSWVDLPPRNRELGRMVPYFHAPVTFEVFEINRDEIHLLDKTKDLIVKEVTKNFMFAWEKHLEEKTVYL